MQLHQEGLQPLGIATSMFEIIKSQSVRILWGITHAAGDQGPIKVNDEAIRNMPRKNILYHKIEENSLLESMRENLKNVFSKKLPSLRNLLGAAAEPEEGYSMLGNEREQPEDARNSEADCELNDKCVNCWLL